MFIRELDEEKDETLGETFNKVFTLENYRDAERISSYLIDALEKNKKRIEVYESIGNFEKVKALKESSADMQKELESFSEYLSLCRIMFRKSTEKNDVEEREN